MRIKSFLFLFVWLLIGCIGFNLAYSQPIIREAFHSGLSWKTGGGLPDYGSSLNMTMEQGLPKEWRQAKGWPGPPIDHNAIK